MDSAQKKEDLSISYLSAVCASAGFDFDIIRHDDDSTDGIIKQKVNLGTTRAFIAAIRIQLKCTSSASQYTEKENTIFYKLKVKNYSDLRLPGTIPIILGLLILPEDESQWLKWTPQDLLLKGCMYWTDFSKMPDSSNHGTVTVRIPKDNMLNPETLPVILNNLSGGDVF